MANPQTNLRVRISTDLADIKSGLATLRGDLAKVQQRAATALPDTRQFESGLKRVRGLLTGLFAGVSAGALLRGIVGETGQAQAGLAQLRAALKSTRQAAGLTEADLVGMTVKFAKATIHSADEITEAQVRLLSYSGIAKNEFPRALQLAIDQSVRLGENITQSAETVGKALEYPAEGVSALTKQGFRFTDQQKKLLKELEKTGRLAEAQAIVMGVMEESYRGAAEAARNTLPGAMKAVRNAFSELLDGSGGNGVRGVVESLNHLATVLGSASVKDAFAKLADQVLKSAAAFATWMAQDGVGHITRLAEAVVFLIRHLDVLAVFLGTRLAASAVPALIKGFTLLRSAILAARTASLSLTAAMALLGGPIGVVIAALAAGIYYLATRTSEAAKAAELHTAALDENRRISVANKQEALEHAQNLRVLALAHVSATRAALANAKAELEVSRARLAIDSDPMDRKMGRVGAGRAQSRVDENQALLAQAEKQLDEVTTRLVELAFEIQQAPRDAATAAAIAAADAAAAAGSTTKAVRGLINAAELAQDAIKRSLEELERLLEAGDIGITDYYSRRIALQQAAIDGQIAMAQAEAKSATTSEAQSKALTEIVKLQRDRAEIGIAGAREQEKAESELAQRLQEVAWRLQELDGDRSGVLRARMEAEHAQLKKMLSQLPEDAKVAGLAMIDNLINREVAQSKISEFKTQLQELTSELSATEASLSAQSAAGMLGGIESERQIREARVETIEQLRVLRDATLEYLGTLSPDSLEYSLALQGLREIDGALAQVVSSQEKFRQQAQDVAVSALSTFFTDLATGAKSAKDALRDFVLSFVQGMAQIAARALATFLVLKMLDAIYPGLGKATAATMSAGVHHAGGIVGAGGGVRTGLSPLLFGAAPRYHNGGIAGLAPNEVPAILEKGEEVLTRNDPRHRDNAGGGSPGVVTTPIVAIGDDAVANALAGAAGESVVMTHVRNNWEGLQRGG